MKGWRLVGVVVFSIFALMEAGDWVGLWPGYSDPGQYAQLVGLSTEAEIFRLIVLSTLATGIVVCSLATVVSLFRRARTARFTSAFTGGLFMAYGVYQLFTGMFQLRASQQPVMVAGVIYVGLGIFAIWLGRKAYRAARRERLL